MKKISTILAMACGMAALPALADTVEVKVQTYDYDASKWVTHCVYESELTRNGEGAYVMADFLGNELDFTFEVPAVGEKVLPTVVNGDYTYFEGYGLVALRDSDGLYPDFWFTNTEGQEVDLFYPYLDMREGFSYIKGYDEEEYGYRYGARFATYGYDENDEKTDLYYVTFKFSDIEEELADNVQVVTVRIEDYDGVTYGLSQEAKVVANADGSYTMVDFLSSDADLTFSFTPLGKAGWIDIVFDEENLWLPSGYTYPYLLRADGKYATPRIYGFNGEDDDVMHTSSWIYLAPAYSGVYEWNNGTYYVSVCYVTEGCGEWLYAIFTIGDDTTGVTPLGQGVDSATVYDINGRVVMREANPSSILSLPKGIYIINGKKIAR